jgi:hypothetical protein
MARRRQRKLIRVHPKRKTSPPPQIAFQDILMAAETAGEYFS